MLGQVSKWLDDRGFGYIEGSDGRAVFVHHTAIQAEGYRELRVGQAVEFDLTEEARDPKAHNVRVISADSPNADQE